MHSFRFRLRLDWLLASRSPELRHSLLPVSFGLRVAKFPRKPRRQFPFAFASSSASSECSSDAADSTNFRMKVHRADTISSVALATL